ncbi:MAG: S8 family peptidase [Clostridiales bacterium]|nr:S8 family peptidase [Clostridiales bacterium]
MDDFSGREDVDAPSLVDFGTRQSDALRFQLEKFPFIKVSKSLDMNFCVLYIPEDKIAEVFSEIGASNLTTYPTILGLMGRRDVEAAQIHTLHTQPYMQLSGENVLLGFIDTGIDFTKDAFKREDGATKIKFIWDQSFKGRHPEHYGYGAEYSEEDINAALSQTDPFEAIPHRDSVGHGTFLASVAAGADGGAAPKSCIISVKLRKMHEYYMNLGQVPETQENAFSSNDLMLGVDYIVTKAAELGMPVSICIGLGGNASSHDGYNYLEEYLSHVSQRPGVIICCAAGNECIASHHASGSLKNAGDSFNLDLTCGETAQAGRGFTIHIWNGQSDRLAVSLTSPAGEKIRRIPAATGTAHTFNLILETSRVTVEYFFPNPKSGSQFTWIKVFDPAPGIWTVTIYGERITDGHFDAWLPITGFVDPSVKFLSPSSDCTITPPGTAMGIITIGSCSALTRSLAPESSWGPTRLPSLAPDLVAPGVEVRGIFPDGEGTMSGTSAACAVASGACALMLQWGVANGNMYSMNTPLAKAYLIRGADKDPGISYPNEQWGYGRLNLLSAFQNLTL